MLYAGIRSFNFLQSLPSYTRVSVEGIVDTVSNVDIISIQQLTSSISIQYNLKHYFLFMGGSLAVVRSYAPGCEPLVTGNLAMGLTIRSSHKQELSSVYQFIDVLYSLCIYEALRH